MENWQETIDNWGQLYVTLSLWWMDATLVLDDLRKDQQMLLRVWRRDKLEISQNVLIFINVTQKINFIYCSKRRSSFALRLSWQIGIKFAFVLTPNSAVKSSRKPDGYSHVLKFLWYKESKAKDEFPNKLELDWFQF